MAKAPAFQWYVKDAESDEVWKLMTLEQRGAYLTLLGHEWINGSIPADEGEIRALLGVDLETFDRVWSRVHLKFKNKPRNTDRLINVRLETQRKSQETYRKSRRESGLEGARKRWGKGKLNGRPKDLPSAKDSSSSSSASAITSPTNTKKRSTEKADPRFRPVSEMLFTEYEGVTGLKLNPVFDGSDGEALKKLLQSLPAAKLEDFREWWINFLETPDEFHRKQIGQHPVRWWATRINAFRRRDGPNLGKHTLHNVHVGKDWSET